MVRNTGAQVGLLAFAIAIIAGLSAGNSPTVIVLRAVGAMLCGAIVGQITGWAAKTVLREHLQRKKQQIDQEHLTAMAALPASVEAAEAAAAPKSEPMEAR